MKKQQWQVGVFVVIGLFLVLISIFLLGADRALFKSFAYINARFEQVQGLNQGSVVSLSGVNVGNVHSIQLSPPSGVEIKMRIERAFLNLIPKTSQVEIRTQGALGDKYIFIIPGPSSSEPLKNGDSLEVAKATDIIGVISERGKETERIFDIINEIYKLTKTMNSENRVDRLLYDLADSTHSLKQASQDLQKLTQTLNSEGTGRQLASSVDKMDRIMTKIDQGQGTLGALINDPSLHNQLKSFLGGSQRKDLIRSVIRTSIEKSETRPQE